MSATSEFERFGGVGEEVFIWKVCHYQLLFKCTCLTRSKALSAVTIDLFLIY